MSGPLVRAILAGNKTQTRRPIKKLPDNIQLFHQSAEREWMYMCADGSKGLVICPYGQPGDQLWIKETYRVISWNDMYADMGVEYRADGKIVRENYLYSDKTDPDGSKTIDLVESITDELLSKGCETDEEGYFTWEEGKCPLNWKPSIFMPRGASRITLEIEEIRIERLYDISEEDAKAEGVEPLPFNTKMHSYRKGFMNKWVEIYGQDSANSNPWVWAISFKRIEP